MKILIFYTHNQSFLSFFFEELALKLSERGNTVRIISIKDFKPKIITRSANLCIEIITKGSGFNNFLSIFRKIKEEKPDVIISQFSFVNSTVLLGRICGIKKNIVWHHTLTEQLNPKRGQIFMKSQFLKMASEIIVNSEYLKEDLVKNYRVKAQKITSIPFWSSLEDKGPRKIGSNSILKIGCPGRIEVVKNQQLIVEALAGLELNFPWRFYIAGSGADERGLKLKISSYNLQDKVDFLGLLDIEKMQQYYGEMDLIVLPSKFEAFGLVLIEALSMGCPVLVSENFGALTYIDDQDFLNRYTFDPNDVNDLKYKLQTIISNPLDPSEYFRSIYRSYFQKEKIIQMVNDVLQR